MRSLLVVVPHELIEDGRQVPLIKHDHVVEALAAERPDDSFGDGVHLRRQLPAVAVIRNDSV